MIVGPWTGEFGYELVMWIPYLLAQTGFRDVTAIGRGGNHAWYPCPVINLFDVVSPEEFRELYLRRKTEKNLAKQYSVDELDRLILDRLGLETDLHPMKMWRGPVGLPKCQKLPAPLRWPGLPDEYVAVRMYRNAWLRDVPSIKEDLPVVALTLEGEIDDHEELPFEADIVIPTRVIDGMDIQNRVISHAKKLICPYGGMVYVGLLYGIPVEAHSEHFGPKTWLYHQELHLAKKFGGSLTRILQK